MTALYGTGLYTVGLYGAKDPVVVPDPPPVDTGGGQVPDPIAGSAFGAGAYGAGPDGGTAPSMPTPIGYGAGAYGEGPDGGAPPEAPASAGYGSGYYGAGIYGAGPVTPVTSAGGYGYGKYGAGLYTGTAPPPAPGGTAGGTGWNIPLRNQPMHLLGIGPWNPVKAWRGAVNYGIGKGLQSARPIMSLPATQSTSFKLVLNDGCEATAELAFTRGSAIIIEEMSTDLWWRRKDPQTGLLEMIGRFNCSSNDLIRGSDGTLTSSLQFLDYRTLLGERLILKYKVPNATTTGQLYNTWPAGTPVTEIMRYAVPTNMGLDISAIAVGGTDLGTITSPITVDPSSSVAQVFNHLLLISPKKWEWWVETPTDLNAPPKLSFVVGQRGRDRGVVLFDYGTGPTPIDTWTMRATGDTYANALYFYGDKGGVVDTIPAQITEFGQRDATYADQSGNLAIYKGDITALTKGANAKLIELSDRRPTFTLNLRNGFWKGRNHIDVGDLVHLKIRLGAELLDYDYRVSEISVAIDGTGLEQVSLTLGTPLASSNPRSRNNPLLRVIRNLKNYVAPPGSTTPTT